MALEREVLRDWHRLFGLLLTDFFTGSPFIVEVERDNGNGRRFYERAGFADPRALTREVQGYALALVEYRRPIPRETGERARDG